MNTSTLGMGPLEIACMQVMWATDQPLTIRQTHQRLIYDRTVAYTTVATILQILARKGHITRHKHANTWQFKATTPLAEHLGHMMRALLDESPDKIRTLQYALQPDPTTHTPTTHTPTTHTPTTHTPTTHTPTTHTPNHPHHHTDATTPTNPPTPQQDHSSTPHAVGFVVR